MSTIARAVAVVGSLYALMRNRLGLNVATSLESQEMSCTVAPDRRLVVLGHEPIAGFARDHGTVANEAAMLALHTLDSTTLLAEPRFVAAGDSCLRADDPGWRWHCISGHGQSLSDWERRPITGHAHTISDVVGLSAAIDGKADATHSHAISDVTGLINALDGKQSTLANAAALARITAGTNGLPLWDNGEWPGGGGPGGGSLLLGLRHWVVGQESDNAAIDLHSGATCTWVGTAATAAGLVGRALSFAGSSHVLLPADAARFDPIGGLTVAAWAKCTQAGTLSAVQYICGANKDYAANKRTFWIQLETARTITLKRSLDGTLGSAGSNSITGSPATKADAWALIVATYSSQIGMHIYTLPAAGGGDRRALASSLDHHYNDDSRLAIGAFSETYSGERFVGLIDSVGVWDRALRPEEIAYLWKGGAGRAYGAL